MSQPFLLFLPVVPFPFFSLPPSTDDNSSVAQEDSSQAIHYLSQGFLLGFHSTIAFGSPQNLSIIFFT